MNSVRLGLRLVQLLVVLVPLQVCAGADAKYQLTNDVQGIVAKVSQIHHRLTSSSIFGCEICEAFGYEVEVSGPEGVWVSKFSDFQEPRPGHSAEFHHMHFQLVFRAETNVFLMGNYRKGGILLVRLDPAGNGQASEFARWTSDPVAYAKASGRFSILGQGVLNESPASLLAGPSQLRDFWASSPDQDPQAYFGNLSMILPEGEENFLASYRFLLPNGKMLPLPVERFRPAETFFTGLFSEIDKAAVQTQMVALNSPQDFPVSRIGDETSLKLWRVAIFILLLVGIVSGLAWWFQRSNRN